MTSLVAGMIGLGGPELVFVLVLSLAVAAAVVLVVKAIRKPNQFARYCPKCGRGPIQPPDAPFCSYCGERLL